MSDFSGLRLALTALQAQQRSVNVAAQNVANANTPGYTRQAVNLVNIGAPAVPAAYATFVGDGQGVKVDSVTRFRDQFMEIRAALEHGSMASMDQASSTMNSIQQLFNEPSDSGIQKQLSDLWAGFDDVANNPSDAASRTQLLERADTLAASFNSISQSLTQQKSDTVSELGATVADINNKAASIAQLNKAIKTNTIAGLPVNDLEDQRDLLANQLSEASGASLRAGTFNQVNVMLNGTALVQEDQSTALNVDTSGSGAVLRWATDNSAATVTSGKAGGELNAINATIPNYIAKLDNVATTLRDEVNQLHGAIGGSLAVANQNQSAAGNLQFDVGLDNGAFSSVTVAGADWSGAGGAAALQTALQTAMDTAIGAGTRPRPSRAATAARSPSPSPPRGRTSCRSGRRAPRPDSPPCWATPPSVPTASAAASSSRAPTPPPSPSRPPSRATRVRSPPGRPRPVRWTAPTPSTSPISRRARPAPTPSTARRSSSSVSTPRPRPTAIRSNRPRRRVSTTRALSSRASASTKR